MKELEQLDNLYRRYGFEVKKQSPDVRVYGIRQGVFYGVEIVPISSSVEIANIKSEYERAGFATRIRNLESVSKIEDELFNGFFDKDAIGINLRNQYRRYVEKRSESINSKYKYIPCPFRVFSEDLDRDIIDYIQEVMNNQSPQLILVEAAAGFGKTSTAYELLNRLISTEPSINPIFAELSRNRKAKIFRYVLLDEIDRMYPFLNSEIVEYEIKSGRIPLIVDGFDELLQQDKDTIDGASFNAVEAMLETIGDLLEGAAKIVLTSRRTAIFAGDEFHSWMDSKSDSFEITRIKIDRPEIRRWIGPDKAERLENEGAPLVHLSSPVILSYIRSLEDKDFNRCCNNLDLLIQTFFSSMLEREQERQALRLSVDEQLKIFTLLAHDMVSYDISSEEKSFISDLIIDRSKTLLSEARQRYGPAERPSIEELVDTLCNHALLDRVGSNEDSVGFINQFVYGYLIGFAALDADENWIIESFSNDRFVSLSSTAFSVRSDKARQDLYCILSTIDELLPDPLKLSVDVDLTNLCAHRFSGATFESMSFTECAFSRGCLIENSSFVGCSFDNAVLDRSCFLNVNFIDCTFKDCFLVIREANAVKPCWFLESTDYNSGFIDDFKGANSIIAESRKEPTIELEVMQQFWPIGRPHASKKVRHTTLLRGFDLKKKALVPLAVTHLKEKGWIDTKGEWSFLVNDKIDEIKKFLGR